MYLFDLDGTVISGYMDTADKDFHRWQLLPGVARRWSQIRWQTGNDLAIITNQAGVAFGHVTEADVQRKLCAVGARLRYGWIELHDGRAESVELDTGAAHMLGVLAVYVCYNDARSHDPRYQDASRRKPSGAMIREAVAAPGYHVGDALFVGDRPEDQQAAADAGAAFMWAAEFFEETQ